MKLYWVGFEYIGIPDFVHEFGHPTPHIYKGSLRRHLAIEKPLYKIRDWLINHDAMPGYHLLWALTGIVMGLNCNLPYRDVALYAAWYLRGCKPLAVFDLNKKLLWMEKQ